MVHPRHILIVDDNSAIHEDFKKILKRTDQAANDFAKAEASLFGSVETGNATGQDLELTHSFQGDDAIVAVSEAVKAHQPYSMAFVDVRMPPGMDGVETTQQLLSIDQDLQIILCTAYADYSWKDMQVRLGVTDRVVILKKPFDAVEVLQLVCALTEKWKQAKRSRLRVQDLEYSVNERTQELEEYNQQLRLEIGQRQLAEQELRGTQEKLKHFLANNPAVLYSLKFGHGRLIPSWVSDNFTTFTGYATPEWYGQVGEANYVMAEDRTIVTESLSTLLARDGVNLEYRIRRRDGAVRWVRDDRQLLRDPAEQPVEVIGCWTDITERKLLEDQLRQSQKMEAFGQLAGGVAHDFNNLLTIIQGYICLMQAENLPADNLQNHLCEIAKATDRAANLTRQLLTFTRRQIFQPKPIDLNQVIVGTSQMMQKLVGESITLETNLMAADIRITADQHMLEQILINLAANARDAMPRGGQLVIATALSESVPESSVRTGEARPGLHACLSVTDTGSGIAPEHLPRIFEPFFTTKEVGKGTGLGLASVYGIIKQHQGWIETVSSVGKGTTFKIYFPATARPVNPAGPVPPVLRASGGSETILVVEDEPVLRELFEVTLQRYGYKVYVESSGALAFQSWHSRLDAIDLLLTDVVMPGGVSGWELVNSMRAQKPQLKAICMSGHNAEINNHANKIQLLAKPFSPEQLAETVRACLDDHQQRWKWS